MRHRNVRVARVRGQVVARQGLRGALVREHDAERRRLLRARQGVAVVHARHLRCVSGTA